MWCETEAFYNYTVSWSQLERDGLDSHSGLCDVKLRLFTTTLVSWSQLETIKSGLQSGPRHQLCSLCLCRTSHSEAVLLQSEVSYHSYPGRQRSRFHRGLPASWQRHSMLWLARRPLQIRAELATQPSVATFPAFRFFCSLKATYLGRLCACWVHWVLGNPGCNVSSQWLRPAYLGLFLSWHVRELAALTSFSRERDSRHHPTTAELQNVSQA